MDEAYGRAGGRGGFKFIVIPGLQSELNGEENGIVKELEIFPRYRL